LRLSGILVFALQDSPSSTLPAASLNLIDLVLHASAVVQGVLVILLLFSAASWAIIVYKSGHLRRAARQNAAFLAARIVALSHPEVGQRLREQLDESKKRYDSPDPSTPGQAAT